MLPDGSRILRERAPAREGVGRHRGRGRIVPVPRHRGERVRNGEVELPHPDPSELLVRGSPHGRDRRDDAPRHSRDLRELRGDAQLRRRRRPAVPARSSPWTASRPPRTPRRSGSAGRTPCATGPRTSPVTRRDPALRDLHEIGAPVVTATYGGPPAVRGAPAASSCDTAHSSWRRGPRRRGDQAASAEHARRADRSERAARCLRRVESVDKLTLRTLDGGPLAPGRAVDLTADVIAFIDQDVLDVFYCHDHRTPTWTLVGDASPPAGAAGRRRYLSRSRSRPGPSPSGHCSATRPSADACGSAVSGYSDQDDLVIELNEAPAGGSAPTVSITSPAALAVLSRTVLVRVDATDDVAVTSVQLFSRSGTNQTWIAARHGHVPAVGGRDATRTSTSTSPSSWPWRPTTRGRPRTAIIEVDVDDRTPPAVAITDPGAGQSFSRAGAITLGATAQDPRRRTSISTSTGTVGSTWLVGNGHESSATWDATTFSTAIPHTVYAQRSTSRHRGAERARAHLARVAQASHTTSRARRDVRRGASSQSAGAVQVLLTP